MGIKRKAIWISYDFGLKGDYTGLYTWLDNHGASECGYGLAYCNYDTSSISLVNEELIEYISRELKEHIKLSKTDRLYIIWKDTETKKVKGEFVSGSRKQSPWEGFGKLRGDNTVDTAE